MTYILIGITFMFCIEFLINSKNIKKYISPSLEINWMGRTVGILLWPIWLGIFMYNFFKEIFK